MTLAYTPYDGTSTPFTIGLKQLDETNWLEKDHLFDAYMTEKARLYDEMPDKVFVEEDDTRAAQREVLGMVADYLGVTAPAGDETAPLKTASLMIQEDLIVMRRGESGWRLAAGSLCFPSSWSLTEKFGRAMQDIHAPVPGFGPGTRMAELINRMFDNLRVDRPVERMNWSLQGNDHLYHPLSHGGRVDRAEGRLKEFSSDELAAGTFMRVERQTLRKLPESGDILFTIRIFLDPLTRLAAHQDRAAIATSFAGQLDAMQTDQLAYKGLKDDRDRLVEALHAIAGQ